jgi:hypothetical protein
MREGLGDCPLGSILCWNSSSVPALPGTGLATSPSHLHYGSVLTLSLHSSPACKQGSW